MADTTIDIAWEEKMRFSTSVNGHDMILDADESVGGEDKGPRPKPMMLVALGGCTGMDVISILRKMRVDVDDFHVKVEGELTDEHPRHYHRIHVVYEFRGDNLPMDKLEKAVSLSEERYCGVSAVYRQAAEMTSEIRIIEDPE
jgi:putative redox protein